jgi:hypothetical protein
MRDDSLFMIEIITSFQSFPLEGNILLVGEHFSLWIIHLPSIIFYFSISSVKVENWLGYSENYNCLPYNRYNEKCVIALVIVFNNELTETFCCYCLCQFSWKWLIQISENNQLCQMTLIMLIAIANIQFEIKVQTEKIDHNLAAMP